MSKIGTIFLKEFKGYFLSPMAYVIITVFLLIGGFFFYVMISHFSMVSFQLAQYGYPESEININDMVLRPFSMNLSLILLMVIPMITMRLVAEERKSGTAELLLTAPVSPWHVILGKFLAAVGMIGVLALLSFAYPLICLLIGDPDPGPMLTSVLGLFLLGSAFVSCGLLASAASENQIVAAVATFGFLLLLWVVNWASIVTEGTLSNVLEYLSVLSHYEEFAKGIIDTKHIVFLLSLIFFPLFLSAQLLAARHGR